MACTLYITVGIPGSGKSTGVKKLSEMEGLTIICPDDIREELTGSSSDQSQNEVVWKEAYSRLHKALKSNKSVVFDATSVNVKARKPLIEVGKKYKCYIVACVFPITLRKAIERQSLRDRKVPADIIEKFYNRFAIPSGAEGFDKILVYNN